MSPDVWVDTVEVEGTQVRLRARVPEDLRFFAGHFEGNPMLPGIAQVLVLVDRRARAIFGPLGRERAITRLKFERVICPGDALDVLLERSEASDGSIELRFRIECDGRRCTSGTVLYHTASGILVPQRESGSLSTPGFAVESGSAARNVSEERPGRGSVGGGRPVRRSCGSPSRRREAKDSPPWYARSESMESPPQYLPLTAFLPHRPPMLLLDRLLEHDQAHAVCEAHVVSDGLFVEGGGVSALIALELFAQAAAAHIGYEWYVRGDAAGLRRGALLGTRRIDLLVDRLAVGDRLVVRATHVMSMPPVAQYEGTLFREGEVIASGTISVAAGVG